MKFADGIYRLGTETAFEVLAKAKALEAEGKNIIHLQIGEPDFTTPKNICDAAIRSIQAGDTHYTAAQGIPEVRKAISDYVTRTRGVKFSPENVVMTPGAKPIMFFVILALIQKGDEVIYPNPGFPIYESMINFVGGTAVPMPLKQENNFNVDINEFRKMVTDKTKLVIINSPGNPTGSAFQKRILKMAEILKDKDCYILSDEIYQGYYDGYHIQRKIDGFKERQSFLTDFPRHMP
jgi:aspartate/methionine/tyrosine aminotransferase